MKKAGELTLEVMRLASWYNNWLFSLVEPQISGRVLEVGAGIGNFTELLADKYKVTAIDLDRRYVKKLKKKFKDKVEVGLGDIEKGKYFFLDRRFDTLLCLNVLEHIQNDEKALVNTRKLLKSKGRLVLLVPAHQAAFGSLDKNLGHFRRYSRNDLVGKLEKLGFSVESIYYLNWLGFLGWFFNSKTFKRKVVPGNQLRLFNFLVRPFLLIEKIIKPPFGLSILAVVKKR
jgi:SAM-dependent methyltransferase